MRDSRDLYSHRPLPDGHSFSIAVLQPEEIPEQPDHAGEMYADLISSAGRHAKRPLKLVVLPELSLVGDLDGAAERAEPIPGWTSGWAEDLAEQLDIFLVISIPEMAGNKSYVSGALIGPDGIVGRTRRAHKASVRNAWADQGDHPFQTWDTPLGRLGILSGEDSLFPEAGRCMAIRGADIICVPAAVTGPAPIDLPPTEVPLAEEIRAAPDRAYWHLWRVRAAENNVYMAFANRSDKGCMGWSGVFGPNLFQFPRGEALIDGRREEYVWVWVNTRDYLSAQAPNPVRFKPMIQMRMPTYYDELFSPAGWGSVQ
jgi:predicted amidohydrolase